MFRLVNLTRRWKVLIKKQKKFYLFVKKINDICLTTSIVLAKLGSTYIKQVTLYYNPNETASTCYNIW